MGDAMRTGLAIMVGAAIWAGFGPPAAAQSVEPEVTETPEATVRFYPHDFLTDEEVATLRLVASNPEARAIFIPTGKGFAALAVAPREGFVRKAQPVESATAVAGATDAAGAAADALAGCEARRKRRPECVIVLEVAVK